MRLGELLVKSGKLTEEQIEEALKIQGESGKRLGEVLVSEGILTEKDVIEVLEFQLGIPYIDLEDFKINLDVVKRIPENIVRKYELIAIDERNNILWVAMVDPLNVFALDDIKLYVKTEIQPMIAERSKVLRIINKYYSADSSAKKVLEELSDDLLMDFQEVDEGELAEVASAPIVRLLNSIIEQAARTGASDIHIEPFADEVRVRIRIDGDLREIMRLNKSILSALTTRVKIIGKMNIAEKRIPQDGRVETTINDRTIDMRISTLPTVYGEKTVMRLLDKGNVEFKKDSIGFSERDMKVFDKILSQPYGVILVTGPTGSGKTTTLYTVLSELNKIERNIITVEDPVEYKLNGINQVQVNAKAGLTFASGLRSILRQDPDIVMVGEIRDNETAEIAIRAAITGHLVLSTLHTNDSPSTIARLIDMGIEPYLVSSSTIGIISQRLVKRLCPKCKVPYEASKSEKEILGVDPNEDIFLVKAGGCSECVGGYRGRAPIHEVLPINEDIRILIDKGATTDEIRAKAIENGMTTLLGSASRLALTGVTSFEEVLRVGFTLG